MTVVSGAACGPPLPAAGLVPLVVSVCVGVMAFCCFVGAIGVCVSVVVCVSADELSCFSGDLGMVRRTLL